MRERPNRMVSKTIVAQVTVGSNPTPSATCSSLEPNAAKPWSSRPGLLRFPYTSPSAHSRLEPQMSDPSYPGCVRALYESEIFGEAVFRALVGVAKTDRERYQFGTLLQLETETKARLRPLLFKHGVSLEETMEMPDIDGIVAGYQAITWPEFAAANIPVVEGFLAQFEAIRDAGSDEDRDVLQSMIHHEAAILRWVTMESKGDTAGSLDDVVAQLQYPLPAPSMS